MLGTRNQILPGPTRATVDCRLSWEGVANLLEIENRFYGPDCNEDELQAIHRRVFPVEDNVFVWHEMPKQTVFSVQAMAQSLHEKTRDLSEFYMIGDLTNAGRPSAEVRQTLREVLVTIPGLVHLSTMVGNNVVLLIAAKFIFSRLGLASWDITRSMEASRAEISRIKEERRHNGV